VTILYVNNNIINTNSYWSYSTWSVFMWRQKTSINTLIHRFSG